MFLFFLNPTSELCNKLVISEISISSELKKLYSESRIFRLDDLFEIRYGLLEQRFKDEIEGMKDVKVVFIKPSIVREADSTLESPGVIEAAQTGKKDKASTAKAIHPKHILEKEDIIINAKGVNSFVDLSQSAWSSEYIFVASHHYVVLRLKTNILDHLAIERAYIVATLRFVIEKVLKQKYEEEKEKYSMGKKLELLENEMNQNSKVESKIKTEDSKTGNSRRSISSILPALSIDDLKSLQIAVPKSKENQKAIVEKYNNLEELRKGVEATITVWEQQFLKINTEEGV
jgi:hypothetical protein